MYNKDISYSLLVVVLDKGKASRILADCKKSGVCGGTIIYGSGTANGGLLHLLELYEIKKEILLMVIPNDLVDDVMEKLNHEYHFEKPGKGIAFTIKLNILMNNLNEENIKNYNQRGGEMNYEAVFVIVERGKADEVIEVADKAGARGATVIHGRGSGIHEKAKLFNLVIEPEKEIVMMLIKKEDVENITNKIHEEFEIDKPGKGIIFSMPVDKAIGLV